MCWCSVISVNLGTPAKFLLTSCRDCRDLVKFVEILVRLQRFPSSCRDCWDLTQIAKISVRLGRSRHDVCEFLNWQDRGEISSISPRYPRSHHDVYRLISQILLSSQQDFLHLAAIGEIFRVLVVENFVRCFWKYKGLSFGECPLRLSDLQNSQYDF